MEAEAGVAVVVVVVVVVVEEKGSQWTRGGRGGWLGPTDADVKRQGFGRHWSQQIKKFNCVIALVYRHNDSAVLY